MAKEFSYGICPYQIMNGHFYVLLNKTSNESFFNFFKGKIEDGESIRECAKREFSEETGVTVSIDDFEDYFFQKSPRKDVGIFLVDWSKYSKNIFKFQKKEIWSATWVPLGEIITSKNQQKIMNDIEMLFKPREIHLRHLYFPNEIIKENKENKEELL